MLRCIELASLGLGKVAPNPMVGALLVYNDRIIGEGYHKKYGEPHAEPNCIASVKEAEKQFISQSTLYASLEPCSHYGKTPPCADLIISHKIGKVVIGCRDPFPEVNGKGIERLQAARIDVEVGVLEKQCEELNKRFFIFHIYHRPFIILKWAQSLNNRIAAFPEGAARSYITNEFTNRLVHKWRSEEAAILVGTNTALADDPELTTRLWKGDNPTRMVVDLELKLPSFLKIFNGKAKTIVFNTVKHEESNNILHYQVTGDVSLVHQIVNALYQLKVQSVIVEGGARLLQSFIDEGMWDEARVITNEELIIDNGLNAPSLSNQKLSGSQEIFSDQVKIYENYLTRSLAG